MLLTFIIIIGNVNNIEKAVIYAIIGYAFFIFTTKLDIQWTIIVVLLLLFGFIYEMKLNEKITAIQNDVSLTELEKTNLIDSYHTQKFWLYTTIIAVTGVGAFLYINKKGAQYGSIQTGGANNFNIMKFLFY